MLSSPYFCSRKILATTSNRHMTQPTIPDFIVIDDDTVNNLICTKMLQLLIPGSNIETFTQPQIALEYIQNNYYQTEKDFVVFLDIDMPGVDGWDMLTGFAAMPAQVQNRMKVLLLTSSDDDRDRQRAQNSPGVSGFIAKPLSQAKLKEHFPDIVLS